MGVAGTIFELRPPDFGKILIFSKCSNDSKTMFWYFQRYKKCQKSFSLSIQLIPRSTTKAALRKFHSEMSNIWIFWNIFFWAISLLMLKEIHYFLWTKAEKPQKSVFKQFFWEFLFLPYKLTYFLTYTVL